MLALGSHAAPPNLPAIVASRLPSGNLPPEPLELV